FVFFSSRRRHTRFSRDWSSDVCSSDLTAARRLTAMERFDLEYAEQPVATVGEMVELRRRVSVPLAADELIRRSDDPLEVVEKGGADYIVVKVQPLGGVAAALDLARRAGVPAVVSSALETSVGMYT